MKNTDQQAVADVSIQRRPTGNDHVEVGPLGTDQKGPGFAARHSLKGPADIFQVAGVRTALILTAQQAAPDGIPLFEGVRTQQQQKPPHFWLKNDDEAHEPKVDKLSEDATQQVHPERLKNLITEEQKHHSYENIQGDAPPQQAVKLV